MKLSSLMFWRKPDNILEAPTASSGGSGKSSGSNGPQITNANYNNFIVKAVGFQGTSDSTDFESPETDLSEIKSAADTDRLIGVAIQTYSQLVFKAGYNIVSNNDDAAQYIRSRLRMMSFTTQTPMDILFQQIADDLVTYSNAFLIKARVDSSQMGGIQAKGIYDTNAVGGYFRIDPATVQIKRDKNGTIKNYQQTAGSNSKTFKPTDVVHFYINKKGGAAFGTPLFAGVLEDVKLLRKIEGNTTQLVYRYAMPLYQMKIGLPQPGMQATDQEISEAKSAVEQMNSDGIMVTNEATEFKAIGAEGNALDVKPYLDYFSKRAIIGLNMSESMMGVGGTKSDADSMEAKMHNTVKFFQQRIATVIENSIFNEMLLEGGYNPIGNEDDIVHFVFNEINTETKVKMQTHALNLFQGNLISFQEARQACGYDSDDVDISQLFANLIKQPNDIALIQAKLGGSASGNTTGSASANTGTSGPDKTAASSSEKTTSSTMQPTNQHGTTTAKIQEFSEAMDDEKTKHHVEEYQKKFKQIYKRYASARNDVVERGEDPAIILPLTKNAVLRDLKSDVRIQMSLGIKKAVQDAKATSFSSTNKLTTKLLEEQMNKTLQGMFKDIEKRLKHAKEKEEKQAAFDAVEYRLRFLLEYIVKKAYWYGYVKACDFLKISTVYVDFGQSKDKENHKRTINPKAFTLDDIPAYSSYCTCSLKLN